MRVDFLRPAFQAALTVEARVFHYGRNLVSVDASVLNTQQTSLAADRMVFLTADRHH
jgi:acyl-coenzyme A thioesterase PaaI-like protein